MFVRMSWRVVVVVLVGGSWGCGAADGLADGGPIDAFVPDAGAAPRLVSSTPTRDALDVYPAPLVSGTALRFTLSLRFDAPLDPAHTTIHFGPIGAPGAALVGERVSPTELVAIVPPPPFATTVLADHTTYAIALDALRGVGGAPVADAPVTFTTGALDPLLNHACGHVALGPFADVLASVSGTIDAPRTDTGHVRYTVALAPSGDGTYTGYTRIAPVVAGAVHLFLDEGTTLALDRFVVGEDGPDVTFEATPAACAGITRVARFTVSDDDVVRARFGPQTSPEAKLIVELVGGE